MDKKNVPVEYEFKLPHYLEQDKFVGLRVKLRKHLIRDTILRRSCYATIQEIIFNVNIFAIKVKYDDGTVWNEDPDEFMRKLISIIK